MWHFLFGSVVARPAIVSICGGPQDGQNFDVWWYLDLWWYLDSMCGGIRQMYPICGCNQWSICGTQKNSQVWICGTKKNSQVWICGTYENGPNDVDL